MSALHVACISMYTNFIIHTDVDVSCISVYVCILCRCWRFICQHANLLMCTNLLAYLCNFYWHKHCLHLCKQCVHLYLQVMSTLACVSMSYKCVRLPAHFATVHYNYSVCWYASIAYRNTTTILRCGQLIIVQSSFFFQNSIVKPFVFCLLCLAMPERKVHQLQLNKNNKQWGPENLVKTSRVEATIR